MKTLGIQELSFLHLEIDLASIGENDTCLMSRNTWHYFIKKDRQTIRSLKKETSKIHD